MSAFVEGSVSIQCEEDLLSALQEMGFKLKDIEVHAEPQNLYGYARDKREQVAHIIVRRQHVGQASNDIGFLRTETGYTAYVSRYDSHADSKGVWCGQLDKRLKCDGGFFNELATRSAICAAERKAKVRGFRTTRKQDGRKITLLMERA